MAVKLIQKDIDGYIGLSSDTKPTTNVQVGTVFYESNTSKKFIYSGVEWFEQINKLNEEVTNIKKTNVINYTNDNIYDGVISASASIDLALLDMPDDGTLYFPNIGDATYLLNKNLDLTLYPNITLEFEPGAKINRSTYSITGNQTRIISGINQIFSGIGDILGTWYVKEICPELFGAIGDGVTDDYASINYACNMASVISTNLVTKATLLFPSIKGYGTTSTINIGNSINVIMKSPLIYRGSNNESCLIIGVDGVNNWEVYLDLSVQRMVLSDWTSENNIGIKLFNCTNSEIIIRSTRNFTIGVQFIGSGAGFAMNEIKLLAIINNKIGVDGTNDDGGWFNENNIYGGRFTCFSNVGDGLARYGVRLTSIETDYYNNNNVFYKPMFELNESEATPSEATPILVEYGNRNHFLNIRNEGNNGTTMRVSNESQENELTSGYGDIILEELSVYPTTYISKARKKLHENSNTLVLKSGALIKNIVYYNATYFNIKDLQFYSSSNANLFLALDGITINTDSITIASNRGIGISVITDKVKRFLIKRDVPSTNDGGRIRIRCYDSAGVILTSSDANHPYIKTSSDYTVTWSTSFGGTYVTGVDSDDDLLFYLHDDVASIDIIFTDQELRSFSVLTGEKYQPTSYLKVLGDGVNYATQIPLSGTYAVGQRIYNATPSTGNVGWVCTVAGTPGTWVVFG